MRKWIFSPEKLEIHDFLANDDITFYYHLLKWKEESFEPLKTLSKMFIDRNLLLKYFNVSRSGWSKGNGFSKDKCHTL